MHVCACVRARAVYLTSCCIIQLAVRLLEIGVVLENEIMIKMDSSPSYRDSSACATCIVCVWVRVRTWVGVHAVGRVCGS